MTENLKKELVRLIGHADVKLLKILYATARVYLDESRKAASEEQLYRMVYISDREALCNDEAIEEILQASRRNNPKMNITGLLLHTHVRFLQILEGPYKNVKSVYHKIQKDPRHQNSDIRYFEPVKTRHFSDWHMGSKNITSQDLDFDTSIAEKEKAIYNAMLDGDRASYEDKSLKELKTFMILS